jgi:hypothetical protein
MISNDIIQTFQQNKGFKIVYFTMSSYSQFHFFMSTPRPIEIWKSANSVEVSRIVGKTSHCYKNIKMNVCTKYFARKHYNVCMVLLSDSVTLAVLFVKFSFCKFFCNVGSLKNLFECFYNCGNLKL